MNTAYLNVLIIVRQPTLFPPVLAVQGAVIHSEPASSLAAPMIHLWATVLETSAPTYQEAYDEILRTVRKIPKLRPLLFWLDDSKEAKEARTVLSAAVESPHVVMRRRYGAWTGNPSGYPENPNYCIAEVPMTTSSVRFMQCDGKRGYGPGGLYCKGHARKLERRVPFPVGQYDQNQD